LSLISKYLATPEKDIYMIKRMVYEEFDYEIWPKRIALVTMGGTLGGHTAGSQKIEEGSLLSSLYQRKTQLGFQSIEEINILDLDSSNVSSLHRSALVDTVKKIYDRFDAIVITHGTNTLPYTASHLTFALQNLGIPIVLTGSQKFFGAAGDDARQNLEDAVLFAGLRDVKGIFVVAGSVAIPGVNVKKTTDFDIRAFKNIGLSDMAVEIGSKGFRPVNGMSMEEFIRTNNAYYGGAKTADELEITKFDTKDVRLIHETPDMDEEELFALAVGKKVIILSATGAGDPKEELLPALKELNDKGVSVIVGTQAPDGEASMNVNKPGVRARIEAGCIPLHDMSHENAIIKSSFLLSKNLSKEQFRDLFLMNMFGEIIDLPEQMAIKKVLQAPTGILAKLNETALIDGLPVPVNSGLGVVKKFHHNEII